MRLKYQKQKLLNKSLKKTNSNLTNQLLNLNSDKGKQLLLSKKFHPRSKSRKFKEDVYDESSIDTVINKGGGSVGRTAGQKSLKFS
jgi:hypothetical protein